MEQSRARKNKREQRRVKVLRNAFTVLKELLPNDSDLRTKIEILTNAAEYIVFLKQTVRNLQTQLKEEPTEHPRSSCRYAQVVTNINVLLNTNANASLKVWIDGAIGKQSGNCK
ncbi:twist-related protein-like [Pocillopora verrucosa]|uniref:twist-related protein-like n=1 Tax=Pocillopora verrucosa TaxID=203993 RepID=UPI0033404B67